MQLKSDLHANQTAIYHKMRVLPLDYKDLPD